MDASLQEAARALSAFDPLRALGFVALRDDAEALMLRGIAMAQLGDFTIARRLLSRASRTLGANRAHQRARCLAALAEVHLAARDLPAAERGLRAAAFALDRAGDSVNATYVHLQQVRLRLLLGDVEAARRSLHSISLTKAPPVLAAFAELLGADIAMRLLDPKAARPAIHHAKMLAKAARVAPLYEEALALEQKLDAPVAKLSEQRGNATLTLDAVRAELDEGTLVIDACRGEARKNAQSISLARRPVLLALAAALGDAAPASVPREALIGAAFGAKRINDSLRVRLRVEVARLRALLTRWVEIAATPSGFSMRTHDGGAIRALRPPTEDDASALVALLSTGEQWSTAALALASGQSVRNVQRKLATLNIDGRVEAVGKGKSRRWVAPPPKGFATTLLLPPPSPLRR